MEKKSSAELKKDMIDQITRQYFDDLKYLMQTEPGVRLFRNIISMAGVFSTAIHTDNTIYFYEGARNLANKLIADISIASPERIHLLFQGLQTNRSVNEPGTTKSRITGKPGSNNAKQ